MAKSKNPVRDNPPSLEEVINYITANELAVDPEGWYQFFASGEWVDSKGKDVLNWKQKLWTSHRYHLVDGQFGPCSRFGYGPGRCHKIGVRVTGKNTDGHLQWRCVEHRNTGTARVEQYTGAKMCQCGKPAITSYEDKSWCADCLKKEFPPKTQEQLKTLKELRGNIRESQRVNRQMKELKK